MTAKKHAITSCPRKVQIYIMTWVPSITAEVSRLEDSDHLWGSVPRTRYRHEGQQQGTFISCWSSQTSPHWDPLIWRLSVWQRCPWRKLLLSSTETLRSRCMATGETWSSLLRRRLLLLSCAHMSAEIIPQSASMYLRDSLLIHRTKSAPSESGRGLPRHCRSTLSPDMAFVCGTYACCERHEELKSWSAIHSLNVEDWEANVAHCTLSYFRQFETVLAARLNSGAMAKHTSNKTPVLRFCFCCPF